MSEAFFMNVPMTGIREGRSSRKLLLTNDARSCVRNAQLGAKLSGTMNVPALHTRQA